MGSVVLPVFIDLLTSSFHVLSWLQWRC